MALLALGSSTTNKGFTGHEQLDGLSLIHMGGRVYDAEIGRFLSADPFVQDSTNLQALNRYSYVQNNPLSYTDPSGYFLSSLKRLVSKAWKAVKGAHSAVFEFERNLRRKVLRKLGENQIVSTAISIGMTVFVPGCQTGGCAMLFNAAMADANGGTIAQVLKGAAIGMATSGIPGLRGALGSGLSGGLGNAINSRVAAAMIVGGAMAKAQGGKFIDGVKGAAVGLAAGAIGTGLRNAYAAGANSLGAALDHVKWAFEDMMLPSAEASRGIVTIDAIHPDGSVYNSTGPIETMAPSAPVMNGCAALPGSCVVPNNGTGNSFYGSSGRTLHSADRQAVQVLTTTLEYTVGPSLMLYGGAAKFIYGVASDLSTLNSAFNADSPEQRLYSVGSILAGRLPGSDLFQFTREYYLQITNDAFVR